MKKFMVEFNVDDIQAETPQEAAAMAAKQLLAMLEAGDMMDVDVTERLTHDELLKGTAEPRTTVFI